jgi:hypothetical protein
VFAESPSAENDLVFQIVFNLTSQVADQMAWGIVLDAGLRRGMASFVMEYNGVLNVSKTPFNLLALSGDRSRGARRRPVAGPQLRLEVLEGRALLSHVSAHAKHLNINSGGPMQVARPLDPHPGPIKNEVGTGHAVKISRLYPYYTGLKLGTINGAGAKAYFDGQGNVLFTGIVAGTIITAPKSPDQEQFYVFGINRGAATTPGPFPGRPGITFDSYVEVSVQQSGISASFTDLTTGTTTALPSSSVVIGQDDVKIPVPTSVLGLSTTTPSVNFWTQNVQTVGNYQNISSFTPEFRSFPVAPRPFYF